SSWNDPEPNSMKVDFDAIKKYINDNGEQYRALFERFVSADTTLTLEEVAIVYYGNRIRPLTYPGGDPEAAKYNVRKLNNEGKFLEALDASDAKNLVAPTELRTQWDATVAAYSIKDNWRLMPFFIRYRQLTNVILASGDGKTPATAFKVVNVDDEYVLLSNTLEATKIVNQTLIYNNDVPFDKISIIRGDQEVDIFFNVALWFDFLKGALK
ncbi:MAG: DUF4919 domain-containing protein, partial [Muribaculaceae bacterium]|nr:DUF4919 domain-containing protein [Muribaculaceae bacterium]